MKFSYNEYAFQWSFPEIVAHETGLFTQEGLELQLSSFLPKGGVRKNATYSNLLRSGRSDIYHAGEWACLIRTSQDRTTCIVGASRPSTNTLNSTFSIFAKPEAGIHSPEDLANKRVAVEEDTGSYFTAAQDLSRFLGREQIKLVQVGSPHLRLVSLARGEVEAASLIHPWTELARHMGFTEVVKTQRRNPTLAVSNRELSVRELKSFFRAVNKAIRLINNDSENLRRMYIEAFLTICSQLPDSIREEAKNVSGSISLPSWEPWQPYTPEEFKVARNLLNELGIYLGEVSFQELVHPGMHEVFST